MLTRRFICAIIFLTGVEDFVACLKRKDGTITMTLNVTKRFFAVFAAVTLAICAMLAVVPTAQAKQTSQTIKGKVYEYNEKTDYTFEDAKTIVTKNGSPFGTFEVSGDVEFLGGAFIVNSGNLNFRYSFKQSRLAVAETEWNIVADSGKTVGNTTLKNKIESGAVIVQTSLDKKNWFDAAVITNVFTSDTPLKEDVYQTTVIEQQNGCYYRVIVVYEMERVIGSHEVIAFELADKETKRVSEVYEFYVEDKERGRIVSVGDVPRKELGAKVKTDNDKGYTGNLAIDKNDPHYGWEIGKFTVNGYTRETTDKAGNPVFLKNLGDRVVLWFTLKQDINRLNGKETLTIAEDNGGYDQQFEIPKTYFGRGTLIIRYTDHEGRTHAPVIYTNYLAANAVPGVDTRVQLFEEGDYEVSLDYKIKNNPRQLGSVSVIPTYTSYKIAFRFSVRNGNGMAFPFDLKTGNELQDKAITPNGFRLDMAKSRYLHIDVVRQTIKINSNGTITTDIRFNRPAKDGDSYKDEGIYTFTIKNQYTDSDPITKTIYVGNNRYLLALANSGLSVFELNEKIMEGYIVNSRGTLVKEVVRDIAGAP